LEGDGGTVSLSYEKTTLGVHSRHGHGANGGASEVIGVAENSASFLAKKRVHYDLGKKKFGLRKGRLYSKGRVPPMLFFKEKEKEFLIARAPRTLSLGIGKKSDVNQGGLPGGEIRS